MKNVLCCLFLFSLIAACSNNADFSREPGFTYQKGNLKLISNVILGEDEQFDPSSAHLNFKKCGDFYGFMSRGGMVRLYDESGNRKFLFDKKALDHHYEFPDGLPIAFDFDSSENFLYILFPEDTSLIKVDEEGEIIEKIPLKTPENLSILFAPHLEVDVLNGVISVSLGHSESDLVEEVFFEESPLIGQFSLSGEFLGSFGGYPEEYANSGKFSLGNPFRYYRYVHCDEGNYFLFDIESDIYQYDQSGNFVKRVGAKASIRNYKFKPSNIPYFSDERPKKATNDINYFLSKHNDKEVYYVGVQSLTESNSKNETFLVKADHIEKTITEANLTEFFGDYFHAKLPSIVKSDTLDFFLASPFSDEVRVIRVTIE